MTAALNLGPIAVAVDAGSDVFQFYTSGVLTDAAACGTDLNHAVTLVGYNGEANPPYFILRNSWGTSWGMNGYMNIAMQEGDGVCGVNMEPMFPNLLLIDDEGQSIWTYLFYGIGLLVIIPCSCLCIKRKSKEIEFFHPGQERLGCVLVFEFIILASCLATFIYSQTTTFESYTAQMFSFYLFFAGIHLILLLLQQTLAIAESKNQPGSHNGVGCVKTVPVLIFSIVFILFLGFEILLVYQNVSQVYHWKTWNAFYIFHSMRTTRITDSVLFGCAALVQMIKICNFLSHNHGHSYYEKQSKSHKCLSFIGLLVAFGSLCIILADLYLQFYYEHVGGIFMLIYETAQVVLMMPILHLMIIN